jgi:calcium-translocating P-type ATPase
MKSGAGHGGKNMEITKTHRGLTHSEAAVSRRAHGANIMTRRKRKGFWRQYLASFGDPIIKILLFALAVNVIFLFSKTGWYESVGVAVAVLLATLVSTLSEYGADSAFEKLQAESAALRTRVVREGAAHLVPAEELVVGDLVLLQAGERIPADGALLTGALSIDQAALSGESREVSKRAGGDAELLAGAVICAGEGAMRVARVGDETYYGRLSLEVQADAEESPLKRRLSRLAAVVSRLGYTAAGVVALANLFNVFLLDTRFSRAAILARLTDAPFLFQTLLSTLTLAITVVVMAAPEGLPMMITVALSANMKRMLKDAVLVRRLVGVETAGSMNLLFTDKTGTLTRGKLQLTGFLTGEGRVFGGARDFRLSAPALFQAFYDGVFWNTDSQIGREGKTRRVAAVGGNATDRALLSACLPFAGEARDARLISHEAFESKTKVSFSEIRRNGKRKFLIKGAPEILLPLCGRRLDENGAAVPFSKGAVLPVMTESGEKAVRMLALAESGEPIDLKKGGSLTLVGIAMLRDDVRREAQRAVRQIRSAGIQTVMLTGDAPETAAAIAREVGLLENGAKENAVCTGKALARASDEEVKRLLPDLRVVARVLPADKSRLVRLAQARGLVVGMTGDGVNDAPALKAADVGFAMGSGAEVAKEAGDVVIVDDNISSIAKAVLYGRTIFKSIRKFIIFQLTMNFCAVSLSVVCPFLGVDAPLTVMQMLWVNMIMDTLAGLAFAGEAPQADYMREAPKKRGEEIINRYMYSQIGFMGAFTAALCLFFLKNPFMQSFFRFGGGAGSDYFMTAFFALFIFAGVFNSFNARTHRLNLLTNLWRNKAFSFVMALVCVVQILLIYNGGAVFRTVYIHPLHLQAVVLLALLVAPADLFRKFCLRAFGRKGHI